MASNYQFDEELGTEEYFAAQQLNHERHVVHNFFVFSAAKIKLAQKRKLQDND